MKDSLAMLLKTNVPKMSENGSLAMLMKTHDLQVVSGDVDENKPDSDREEAEAQVGPSFNVGQNVAEMRGPSPWLFLTWKTFTNGRRDHCQITAVEQKADLECGRSSYRLPAVAHPGMNEGPNKKGGGCY